LIIKKNILKDLNFKFFEKKIISNNNRFQINDRDKRELKNLFLNKNILVTGAPGSIGQEFCLGLIKFKCKRIFLLDKNENDLTSLNRLIIKKTKNKNIDYICADINTLDIDNFLRENKINIYLNFAAIKHVRSQENINSIKYMFSTNYDNFYKMRYKSRYLKKIFSISTDKAAEPTSLMGISKLMMEYKLKKIMQKNNNISVCSARFANVSFSRGSILEHALDCIKKKISFGIPSNIKRYFITHEEAVSICFQALLKKNNNSIIIPNKRILGDQISIKEIITNILKIYRYKFVFIKKFKRNYSNHKIYYIFLTGNNITGQKIAEKLLSEYEKKYVEKFNSKLDRLPLKNLKKINLSNYKKIKKSKKILKFQSLISKVVDGYIYKSKQIKVSQII
tara:strand:+ start:69 stop:1250 length:1182 start_codon:yes stop_codon:yes gene_type:complete